MSRLPGRLPGRLPARLTYSRQLDGYLDFSYGACSSTTTFQIKSSGTGTGDHQIKLEGFNSTAYSSFGSTDSDILNKMLADSKLIVGP